MDEHGEGAPDHITAVKANVHETADERPAYLSPEMTGALIR